MAPKAKREALFARLKRGLTEAIAHCRGKKRLRATDVRWSVTAVDGKSPVTHQKRRD